MKDKMGIAAVPLLLLSVMLMAYFWRLPLARCRPLDTTLQQTHLSSVPIINSKAC